MAKLLTVFTHTSLTSTAVVKDSKQFTAKVSSAKKSAQSMREAIQGLIEAGLGHYSEHGDTVYLTKAMDCCIGVQALPTNTIKGYIKKHANVSYVKSGDSYVFQKVKPETKGEKVATNVEMPTVTWFAYNAEKNPPQADYDVITRIKNLIKGIDKAVLDGKVKADDNAVVAAVSADLGSLMAKIKHGDFSAAVTGEIGEQAA